MKYKVINIIILLIALVLVLFFTLKDDFNGVILELSKANIYILLIAVVIFILSYFVKSISLYSFLNIKYKYNILKTFRLTLAGILLNGITPFQSGGQPYQVYILKKDGIRITDSTSAMIKDFISFQISLMLVGVVALLINSFTHLFVTNLQVKIMIACGFLINLAVLIILLFVSFAKKSFTKIVNKIINIRIIKNRVNKDKINESIENFYSSGEELKKNKRVFLKCVGLNILHLLLLYLLPYIVFISFGIKDISILNSIMAITFVMLVGNFIPLPGGTGGIEYSFMQFFGVFVNGNILSGIMLVWRFITYVLGLFIGFIALIIRKGEKKYANRFIY